MRVYILIILLVSAAILIGIGSLRPSYRVKVVPSEARLFSRDKKLVMAFSISTVGWHGRSLASWMGQLGTILGRGGYIPADEKRELLLWGIEGNTCLELRVPNSTVHSLYPVGNELLLANGISLERWTGTGFERLSEGHQRAIEARYQPLSAGAADTNWTIRYFPLSDPGKAQLEVGNYVLVVQYSTARSSIFHDDVIKVRVDCEGQPLCTLRESRAFWRVVSRKEYEQLFRTSGKA